MSLAKLNVTQKSRKEFTCDKCGEVIPKGSKVIRYTVGFRSRLVHNRHGDRPECAPTRSERESSAVASIYAAQDEFDVSGMDNLDDITAAIEAVAEAAHEVAQEYEDNEMFDKNEDLQERAQMINDAADELDQWNSSLEEMPEEEDEDSWSVDNTNYTKYEDALDAWAELARDAAIEAVNNMELP